MNYFKKRDLILDFFVLCFLGFGLLTLFSVSPYYFNYQLIFTLAAVFLYFLVSLISLRNLKVIAVFSFIPIFALLVYLAFFGQDVRGAASWISLGPVNFQPSEISKLLLIFIVSLIYSKKWTNLKKLLLGLLVFLLIFIPVLLQPDLGTSIVLLIIYFSLTFIYILNKKITFLLTLLFIPIGFLLFRFLQPYQKDRIYSFFNPQSDPLGTGYNVIQSKIAIGSGGFLGKGLKNNTQVFLNFLPEPHTDFIFASGSEAYGLVFSVSVLVAFFLFLLWIQYKYIFKGNSFFEKSFCFGVFIVTFFQFSLNIGMNLGLLPITGLTLPLVSYGGSSLLAFILLYGIMQRFNYE